MRRVGSGLAALFGWLLIPLGSPPLVDACTPYEMPDSLSSGVEWAASAAVTDEVENAESPFMPPAQVTLTIHDTLVGDRGIRRLTIVPTDGCHPFWYHRGDRIIAAIGRQVRLRPPYAGISNFSVNVWVIRDGKVQNTVAGRASDEEAWTEEQLVRWLLALPDTSTAANAPATVQPLQPVIVLAGGVGALLGWRRGRRPLPPSRRPSREAGPACRPRRRVSPVPAGGGHRCR